ncbi:MAG: choice-of-anchor L domain-containing protein [Fluviicola sp.]
MKTIWSYLLTIGALCFVFTSNAQLTVNNGFTAQQLGNNLAGNNVNVFNATITGDPDQYGQFNFVGNSLGLNSGVILSTGDIADAVGPNNSGSTSSNMGGVGDADLSSLAGFNTNDAVVFEFEFEVQGDEIEFNFVFMSEEYNEFVNSGFNDVFAFYISGPGIVGQENLAVVPGTTTPVTINTINNGSFFQYYNDNTGNIADIEFDGFTTLMTAARDSLIPCGIYTLSLRIADGSDSAYDSAVLLQENSLVQSNISATSSTFSGNNTALEGCIDASFTFQLDSALTTDVNIPIGIGGTATNGVDYSQIDTLITIPAGQTSATIIIDAIADGITEGQEVIELYYTPSPCQPQDTIFLFIDDYTPLEYQITPTDVTCFGAMDGMVDLSVTGGLAPYTLTLTDSATGTQTQYTNFPVNGLDIGTYYVEVIDGYGCTAEDLVAGNYFDAGQTFLPDGNGVSYTSDLTISGFPVGQTITDINQIVSICATMEHSYANDLDIVIQAPNGAQVQLKNNGPTGGAINACNLGEPVASGPVDNWNNTDITPGIGYEYCWNANPTFATMSAIISPTPPGPPPQYTYTTQVGNTYTDYYLPAGSYTPAQSLAGLLGAPLNGTWTLIVTDNYNLDNGYIFDWSISLAADIPDSVFTIEQPPQPTISHTSIDPDCGLSNGSIDLSVTNGEAPYTYLWSNGSTTEDISGLSAGAYSVDITDNDGCVHTYQVNLSNNGTLVINGTVTDEVCLGDANGAIDVAISGATNPITYSWNNGASTEDISGLAPGNYTVTVSDGAGCQGVSSFTVNAAPQINISANLTNENCGDAEGIIDLTVLGAVNPISFVWSNGETTEDIDELIQGTYDVQITDGNGCTAVDTFTIINLVGNCVPNCDLAITNSLVGDEACGNGLGSIDLTTFTSFGPIQASWDNGATTQDIFNLSAGTYTITLTDNEGCQVVQSYTILNQTGSLAITGVNNTNEYCGNGQGALDATITGGAQPYAYSWSNGATTQDISGLSAGTYTLTVIDDNGCIVTTTQTITNDAGNLTQTYGNAVDEVCNNSQGSIDINISGGQQPYTYLWSNGSTTEDLIGISAGSYSCEITDAGGCSITTPTYTVNNQSGTLQFNNIDVDNEVCTNGLGDIELFISGGVQPYAILWNTGATTAQISNLSAGTYSATVTDANGCSMTTGNLTVLNESGNLALVNVSAYDELCGNGTGSVNITVSGGTAPVSYQWDNGSTSEDLINVSAGNYNCVITDANGCTVFASATVQNDPGILSIDNIIVTDETCGAGDGALDAIISGNANPTNYTWDSGQTAEDIASLNAGTYTLTVTDNNGCTTSASAIVSNNSGSLQLTSSQVTNEICGAANGSIDVDIMGGALPLTYSWSSGQTTEDLSGLNSGTYTLTVTDVNGCSIIAGPFTVNNSSGTLSATLNNSTNETCSNGGGAIDVNVSGGAAPYTYSWSSGQTMQDISGLSAGTYTLTVTDNNGCSDDITVTISNDPGTLTISGFTVTDETCGNGLGAIDISVIGGTPGYSYSWSNGATIEDISGLNAGTFDVTITDAAGCQVNSGAINLTNTSGNFTLDGIIISDESCGDGTGSVQINHSGGVQPITWSWSNGGISNIITGLNAGSYTGTATDANGCTISFSATVMNDPGNLVVTGQSTDATCNGSNGAIDITVSGNNPPTSYLWSNGATTEDISGLNSGTYTVNISDNAGCSTSYSTVVNTSGSPSVTGVTVTDENCGNADGAITVNVGGGTGPYTYNWTTSQTTPCCTYTLEMQDQGNSWNGASVDVIVNSSNIGNFTVFGGGANTETFAVCDGESIELIWNSGAFDAEVSFDLLDATGTVVFSQGPSPTAGSLFTGTATCAPQVLNGPSINGLTAGTYSVVITDANGCQDSTTVSVNNTSGTLQVTNVSIVGETCSNANGSIDLSVTGNAPITYSWDNGATTQDLTDLAAGPYTVTISDAGTCTFVQTYNITNFDNGLAITTVNITDEVCGDQTGAIDISTIGGNGPLSYTWSNGSSSEDLVNLSAGTYSVVISDGSICTVDTTVIVNNNAAGMAHTASITDEACGNTNGAIDITMTGGIAPLTFLWNNGMTSEDLTNISAGTYTCTVTDANGCIYNISETVGNSNGGLIASASIIDEDCGQADGEIDVAVNGGTGPYTYSWTTSQTIPCCTYTLDMQDQGNSWNGASIDVFVGGNFTGNFDVPGGGANVETFQVCNGESIELVWNSGAFDNEVSFELLDASGTIIFSQGPSPTPGSLFTGSATCAPQVLSGPTLTDLSAATYTVTITDANGCSITESYLVENSGFDYSASITEETCSNGNGAIDITIQGLPNPQDYLWNNGATTQDISGLSSGWYSVTLSTNAGGGCVVTDSFFVGSTSGSLSIDSLVTIDESCGLTNGAVDAFITGGTMPFTYSWDNGATTEDISGLTAGMYTLTVTDATGCTASSSVTLSNNTFGFGVSGNFITDENCGDGQGVIDITVSGGSMPYTYAWSHGPITEDVTGLTSGTYTVTITDNSGCTVTASYNVGNNTNGFVATAVVTDETCGDSNGAIDLSVLGGVTPLTYNWSNGAITEDISGLDAGTFNVTITDANGCVITLSESVSSFSENFAINTPIVTDEVCGDTTGSIEVNPTGGTGVLDYSWNPTSPCCSYTLNMYDLNNNGWGGNPIPEVLVYINGNLFGNFTVPAGNGNDFATAEIPICTGDLVEFEYVEAAQNQNNVYEVLDASGNIIFTDGPNPFNGVAFTTTASCSLPNSNILTDLSAGAYPVTITDEVGCQIIDTIIVGNNTSGFVASANITSEYCQNGQGEIDITVTGGVTPYTFAWSTGATTEDISGLSAGVYSVTVSDDAGCMFTETYQVLDSTGGFQIDNAAITDELCTDGAGAIYLTIAGGQTPYTFSWDNGATTEDITGLSAGQYLVNITDNAGCQIVDSFIVNNVNSGVTFDNGVITDEQCGNADGAIDITISGGNLPYTFAWDNGATVEDVSGLAAGQYIVVVTDTSGCSVTDTFNLINNTGGLGVTSFNITDEACDEQNGAIDITVAGGTSPYTYAWSTGATTEDLTGVGAGAYDVTVTDDAGCSFSESFTVNTIGSPVNVTDTLIGNASCATCNDGYIDLTVAVNGDPFTYLWNTGATSQDITFLLPGTYTVTITNVWGCTTTQTFEVKDVTGLEDLSSFELMVYPNPSQGIFNVEFNNAGTNDLHLKVTDATGRIVSDLGKLQDDEGSLQLDLSPYQTGMYFLQIESATHTIRVERLIVKR